MNNLSTVSIIIPCRNEEKYIGLCIDSIINNQLPDNKLEVIVVDGLSEDRTREIVKEYLRKFSFIKLIDNPQKIVPIALNIGIKNAIGKIIMRMDAHTRYEKNYIAQCVNYLEKNDVDNVGGLCITLPGANTSVAKSIAIALSHPFGVGNSYFRIGITQPKLVDTVPFGCYKREVFAKIGLFDEDLIRNQDDEFNFRLIKNGGKILLSPEIVSYYYSRDSITKLWKMYYQYGYFKPFVVRKLNSILTLRQVIPAILVSSLIISSILSIFNHNCIWIFAFLFSFYLLINLIISFSIAAQKSLKYIFFLPIAFLTIHFGYGVGYLKGAIDAFLLKK